MNHPTDEYGGGGGLENQASLPLEIQQQQHQSFLASPNCDGLNTAKATQSY